jgi:tRNA-dihydrouridine synthase B
MVLEHLDAMIEHYGEESGIRIARKHIAWYTRGLPGSAEFRDRANRLGDRASVRAALFAYYDPLLERLAA